MASNIFAMWSLQVSNQTPCRRNQDAFFFVILFFFPQIPYDHVYHLQENIQALSLSLFFSGFIHDLNKLDFKVGR